MARSLKRVLLTGLAGLVGVLVLLFLAGIVVGYLSAHGTLDPKTATQVVIGITSVVMMGGAFWLGAAWMKSIDEAAREAHKWSWYWGGTAGMCVGGVLMLLTSIPREGTVSFPLLFGSRPDPAGYAASGAFSMMILMVTGYTVAWAIWWWRRR